MNKNLELLDQIYEDLVTINSESEELKKILEAIDELQFSIEDFLDKDVCDVCEDKGYIKTYNSHFMTDTIKRCEECNTIESNLEAFIKSRDKN